MKLKRLYTIGVLSGVVFVSGIQSKADQISLEIEKLQMSGPRAQEALFDTLRHENIHTVLEGLSPRQPGVTWTNRSVKRERDHFVVHMSYRYPLSTTVPKDPWGYLKMIGNEATQFLNKGELFAKVYWKVLPSTEVQEFSRKNDAILLELRLSSSNMFISNAIHGIFLEISTADTDESHPEVEISLKPSVQPGPMFPGFNGTVKEMVDIQIAAWSEALINAAAKRQAELNDYGSN
jgi:hypothetical protein